MTVELTFLVKMRGMREGRKRIFSQRLEKFDNYMKNINYGVYERLVETKSKSGRKMLYTISS